MNSRHLACCLFPRPFFSLAPLFFWSFKSVGIGGSFGCWGWGGGGGGGCWDTNQYPIFSSLDSNIPKNCKIFNTEYLKLSWTRIPFHACLELIATNGLSDCWDVSLVTRAKKPLASMVWDYRLSNPLRWKNRDTFFKDRLMTQASKAPYSIHPTLCFAFLRVRIPARRVWGHAPPDNFETLKF